MWDNLSQISKQQNVQSAQLVTAADAHVAAEDFKVSLAGPYDGLTRNNWESVGRARRIGGLQAAIAKLGELNLLALYDPGALAATEAFRLELWDHVAARLVSAKETNDLDDLWAALKLLHVAERAKHSDNALGPEVFSPEIIIPDELLELIKLARRDRRMELTEARGAAEAQLRGKADAQLKRAILSRAALELVRTAINLEQTDVSKAVVAAPPPAPAAGGGAPGQPDATAGRPAEKISIVLTAAAIQKFPQEVLDHLSSELGIQNLSAEDVVILDRKLQRLSSETMAGLFEKSSSSLWSSVSNRLASVSADLATRRLANVSDAVSAFGTHLPIAGVMGRLPGGPWLPPPTLRPAGVADLKVVNQQLQKYQLGEIAYIENVLAWEERERVHTNLEKTEQQIITEVEESSATEKDLQTTERFELAQELSSMQKESRSNEAGVSISAGYGPVSMTVSAKTQSSDSAETATRTSRNNTKETVSKAVERVQKRVRKQQTTTITTETTEVNRHKFAAKDKSVVGVYRYVEKKYWCQILNYGARLMMEFVVPEPATYFLFSQEKGATSAGVAKPDVPNIEPADLNESNYGHYAKLYNAVVTDPPAAFQYSDVYYTRKDSSSQQPLSIDANFEAVSCTAGYTYSYIIGSSPSVAVMMADQYWRAPDGWPSFRHFSPPLRGSFSVVALGVNVSDFAIGVQLVLRRTAEAMQKWQLETYNAIWAAYQSAKEAYDRSIANQSANRPQIQLRSDADYRNVESIELRRACLELLTDQHFDAFGAITNVNGRPTLDNGEARKEAPVVEFFEQAFEWPQMTYTFYPYFWGRKDIWEDRLNLNDVDPIFAKFLKAGSARVVVPVRRNMENDLIFYLKTGDIWGNTHEGEAPLPSDPDYVPITTEIKQAEETMGNQTSDGVPEGAPWQVTIPTPLVCLDADGLNLPSWDLPVPGKPIAYKPSEATCHGIPYNAAQWPDLKTMAAGLVQLGYSLPGNVDYAQYFKGAEGRRTIEAFQRKANEQGVSAVVGAPIKVDGILGPCTLRALSVMAERFLRNEWPGPGVP
ncbi:MULTISPECIES: hypothetical protein [unclassified Bradyrhizobium]|uniref:hypothetical protein n=1 Tax=unclassified Bradyrhizobium TaxID=2631580 RepID=UPI0028F141ED|nr:MULTISPECIES: hypothetical protein [unclassified Bradyrhizobium]